MHLSPPLPSTPPSVGGSLHPDQYCRGIYEVASRYLSGPFHGKVKQCQGRDKTQLTLERQFCLKMPRRDLRNIANIGRAPSLPSFLPLPIIASVMIVQHQLSPSFSPSSAHFFFNFRDRLINNCGVLSSSRGVRECLLACSLSLFLSPSCIYLRFHRKTRKISFCHLSLLTLN